MTDVVVGYLVATYGVNSDAQWMAAGKQLDLTCIHSWLTALFNIARFHAKPTIYKIT
jgi:hypothetical protein